MCRHPTQVRPYWINAKPLVSAVGRLKKVMPLLRFNPEINLVFMHRCSRITYGENRETSFPHCVGVCGN